MTVEEPARRRRAARAAAFWVFVLLVGSLLHGPLLVKRPRPLSRTELALVAAAERALREGDEGFDYAAFFLKQEGAAGTPLEERWRMLAAAVEDASHAYGGPRLETAISSILLVLFRDAHLARYRREQAELSGFLVDQQAGGNCEAQTKLLVASLRASRVALPEDTELGVEVFQDHAQAVLVSRRDRRLWNLLSGEQEMAPRGDVYRPAILLSAYLRGLGLAVPVSDAKLLLLRAPRLASKGPGVAAPTPSFFTTSTLRLPASRARYVEGTPPERTEVPFPLLRKEADGATVAEMDKDVTFRDAFVSGHDPRLLFPIDRVAGAFGLVGTTLVFRRQDDAERYQQAATPAARRALLLDLADAQIRAEIGTRPLELPPIERISAVPLSALDELLARLQRIEWLLGLMEQAVDRVRSTAMVASALELRIPELSRTTRSLRQFSEEAGTEPELFFGRLGALDPARRRRLIAFFVPRLQSAHVRALAAALAEPGRVALSARPDSAASSGEAQKAGAPAEMEIELLDGPMSPSPSVPETTAPPGVGAPGAAFASPGHPPAAVPFAAFPFATAQFDTAEPLPVSAFLDLVLSGLFSSGTGDEALPVLRRWDRAASAAVVHRAGDCEDTLARLRHAVKRPFEETSQRPPTHLLDAEKRLERACARAAVRTPRSVRLPLHSSTRCQEAPVSQLRGALMSLHRHRPRPRSLRLALAAALLVPSLAACEGGEILSGETGPGGTGAGARAGAPGTGGSGGQAGRAGEPAAGGTAGQSGTSGASGKGGSAGASGKGGSAGAAGATGAAGKGGAAGTAGKAGSAGIAGNAGASGSAGQAATGGSAGAAGVAGAAGTGGASGSAGNGGSGKGGSSGIAGASGKGGAAGAAGTAGAGGSSGTGGQGGSGRAGSAGAPVGGSSGAGGAGTCGDIQRNQDETDVDCGGAICPLRCETGNQCKAGTDCVSTFCNGVTCVGSHCATLVRDGDETDVDCGGAQCGDCGNGKICSVPADCLSGLCDNGFCVASAACSNGAQDGNETDLDCGGADCAPCNTPLKCLVPGDCKSGFCDGTLCVATGCEDKSQDGNETDLDCGGACATKCNVGQGCVVPGDCASGFCNGAVCVASACSNKTKDAPETDVDCGGGTCPACGNGQTCTAGTDCVSGSCPNGICTGNDACANTARDGNETDIDCGGADCKKCDVGLGCALGTDCASGFCNGTVCVADQCGDKIITPDETDVDCGGSRCPGCTVGQTCVLGTDCASGFCDGAVCAADHCGDKAKNVDETDVDCGGALCAKCGNGQTCGAAGDCQSGVCNGGTCAAPSCGDTVVNGSEQCDLGPSGNKTVPGVQVGASGEGLSAAQIHLGAETAAAFYDYRQASAHTGNESARQCFIYLYREVATGTLSLITHCGIKGATQPAGQFDLVCAGLPVASTVVVSDDAGELRKPTATTLVGDWNFNANTDGGVVSGLDTPQGTTSITCGAAFLGAISTLSYLLPDGTTIPIDTSKSFDLVINDTSSACRADCTSPRCNDGVLDGGESCDDGDAAGGLCPATCALP